MTVEELIRELRWVAAADPKAPVRFPVLLPSGKLQWLDIHEVEYGPTIKEVRLLL